MFAKFAASRDFFSMKLPILSIFCGLLAQWCLAQAPAEPYFQQEVNYRIAVTLDDTKHTLTGDITFDYINHSPQSLSEIWVHLWGNAYKNRKTAFCKQKLRDREAAFYFAPEEDRGGFGNLDFTVDGQKTGWKMDAKNPDIAVLTLGKPLAPGASIRVYTPFFLKIPASFSRLGHVETNYQITQWYPKPAVYDHKGWHAMPYLDIGEFYSEFGSFDVSLTLPENYVVGATGALQTPSEIAFLHQKDIETRARLDKQTYHMADTFPASSAKMKTIRYTAERVHDFAWFADKRFMVLKDTARLASGKTVDCWAMFPMDKERPLKRAQSNYWVKGAFYVRRAIEFYSKHVGEYPWPQATAVHSALSAGGGMEYPMITVIGDSEKPKDLDNVITHEVGHNWFYGILASNEREHPYLDEGLNSYYESRYMKEYYGQYNPVALPKVLLDEEKQGSLLENGYLVLARDRKDTPPDSHASVFSPITYGLQVYMKPAMCLHWLEQAEGTEKFDRAMQAYYRRWQFRHPYPEDFQQVLTENGLSADWFFDAMRTQKQLDYKITGLRATKEGSATDWKISLKNKGQLHAPFSVTSLYNGQPLESRWFPALPGNQGTVVFSTSSADSIDAFEVDFERKTLDVNRKNNFRRTSGLFPGQRPLEYRPLAILQNTRRNTLAVLPWAGWNSYDRFMLGAVLYNPPVPLRKLQYYLLPGYAFGSKNFVGLADVRYHLLPGGWVPKVTLGVNAKSFDFDHNETQDYFLRFWRVVPQVRAELRSGSLSFAHALIFRTLFIGREQAQFDDSGIFSGKNQRNNTIHEFRYEAAESALPNPYQLEVALETQQYRDGLDRPASYLRGTAAWRQRFFFQPKRKVTMRLFAGYFLQNTQRNSSINETALTLFPQGFNDYRFDQTFLARSGGDGFLARQVSQTDGGFKGAFGSAYAGTIGHSNNFVFALNLKTDLPVRLPFGIPIKPYFDLGYFDDATPTGQGRPNSEQLLWSGGLMLEFFKGGLEIYFPLAHSKSLKDRYCEQGGGNNASALFCGGNYWKTITWSMRLRFSDPVKMVENAVE